MNTESLLKRLSAGIDATGSQHAWSEKHGINQSYVSLVLSQRRPPGPLILAALGVRKVVGYEVLKP